MRASESTGPAAAAPARSSARCVHPGSLRLEQRRQDQLRAVPHVLHVDGLLLADPVWMSRPTAYFVHVHQHQDGAAAHRLSSVGPVNGGYKEAHWCVTLEIGSHEQRVASAIEAQHDIGVHRLTQLQHCPKVLQVGTQSGNAGALIPATAFAAGSLQYGMARYQQMD